MLSIKIRDYFSEDWPILETLLRTNPQDSLEVNIQEEQKLINLYIQQYDFGRTSIALDEQNAIIGYMILRHYREATFLETLFVDDKAQRKGVGYQLIDHAKKLALIESKQILRVAVSEKNKGALQFFIRNDFLISGFIKSDHSLFTNNIHLVLPLIKSNY